MKYQNGEERTITRFAFLPRGISNGETVWLTRIRIRQRLDCGSGWEGGWREWYEIESWAPVPNREEEP